MKNSFLIVLIFIFNYSLGQIDSTNKKAIKIYKMNLTYLWVGNFCPGFIDTEFKYGFKIRCVGCDVDKEILSNNRRVVRNINKVYGIKWFQRHKRRFPKRK